MLGKQADRVHIPGPRLTSRPAITTCHETILQDHAASAAAERLSKSLAITGFSMPHSFARNALVLGLLAAIGPFA
ncbi:hypothetical protein SB767_35000, partial [Bacillus sp. SIMBA_069]